MVSKISALETSLKEKHEKDLKELRKSLQPESTDESGEISKPDVKESELKIKEFRTTKASRRRDQKDRKEHELLERIKAGQVDDADNLRLIEMKRVEARLTARQLNLYEIPSDGDCMYKSIEHQLRLTRNRSVTVNELRSIAADYIRRHKEDFLPFLTSSDGESMMTDQEFEDYCHKIEATTTWGGQPELRALSNSFRVPIEVIQAEGSSVEIGFNEFEGNNSPLILW